MSDDADPRVGRDADPAASREDADAIPAAGGPANAGSREASPADALPDDAARASHAAPDAGASTASAVDTDMDATTIRPAVAEGDPGSDSPTPDAAGATASDEGPLSQPGDGGRSDDAEALTATHVAGQPAVPGSGAVTGSEAGAVVASASAEEPVGGAGWPHLDDDTTGASARAAHASAATHPFARSVGWTAAGTVLPGLGFWPTRLRGLGIALMALAVGGGAALAVQAHSDLGSLAAKAVQPQWLTAIAVGLCVAAVLWVVTILGTHLLTRPRRATGAQRAAGAALVGLLSMLVSAPLAVAATYALAQRDLVTNVFRSNTRSETRPTDIGTGNNPWRNKPRLNIALLGGDNTAARDKEDPDEGIRTDTVMLASIDTSNGNTVLIQLPRNMETFHFPKGSDLDKAYPNGYWDQKTRESPDYELNSVWNNVPKAHPELFKNTDYASADATKTAIEGITGLKPDYFLLLSIDGLQKVIDAMGGVRINVNERIPMGQSQEQARAGIPPSGGWLDIGPNQLLNGYKAMWYARERSVSSDGARMARQSCVVKAVIDQANPQTLLTHYESIADAGKNTIITDVPQNVIPAITQLALTMKNGKVHRLLFAYNSDTKKGTPLPGGGMFEPWQPDTAAMAQLIQQTIARTDPSAGASASATPTASSHATWATSGASSTSAASSASSSAARPTGAATTSHRSTTSSATAASASASATANDDSNADLSDACSYHPSK